MITRIICTRSYHDNLIYTQLYSSPNLSSPRVPLLWVPPFDRADVCLSSPVTAPPPFWRGLQPWETALMIINPALPAGFLPPPFPPRLFCPPGVPAVDPVAFFGLGTVATVGNTSRCCSNPPVPRSAPVHPFVRTRSLPARYPPLLAVPDSIPGTTSPLTKHPTHPDGRDRSRSTLVGWLGSGIFHNFRCASPFYFMRLPIGGDDANKTSNLQPASCSGSIKIDQSPLPSPPGRFARSRALAASPPHSKRFWSANDSIQYLYLNFHAKRLPESPGID